MANPRGTKRTRLHESYQSKLAPSSSTKRSRTSKPPSARPPETPESNLPPTTSPTDASPSDTVYKHDAKYYFDDGDIILRVSNTLFRVHRKKLQGIKGLFQQLFSLPQPDGGVEGTDTIYGIPCCEIFLVSPSDIHFTMGFIYEDVHLHLVDKDDHDWFHWDASLALLRVGSKLELPTLRKSAIDVLTVLFPTELEECGRRKSIVLPLEGERFHRLHAIEAINIAREFDIPSLMPVAYYTAAQLPFADIVSGVTRADGTKEKLCEDDVLRVVQGREELMLSRRHTVFRFLNTFTETGKPSKPTTRCTDKPMRGGETCFYWLMRMNLDFNGTGFVESSASAMDVLPQKSQEMIKSHLCESCWDEFRFAMYNGRLKNWTALPRYFGWDGWVDVIEEQKKSDMHWMSDD